LLSIEKRKTALVNDLKIIEKNIIDIITTKKLYDLCRHWCRKNVNPNLMGDGFLKYLNINEAYEVKGGVIH
jgi:hypothetical protein